MKDTLTTSLFYSSSWVKVLETRNTPKIPATLHSSEANPVAQAGNAKETVYPGHLSFLGQAAVTP